jgi:transcriptional regulator of acetoin/glycerol metabolism
MRLSSEAVAALVAYPWPGNVRELQNAIERAVVVGSPPSIGVDELPLRVTGREADRAGALSLEEVEKSHVRSVLERSRWNVSQAARLLEIDRGTLYNKIEKYGLERPLDG